jgi:chromate transporter
MSLSLLSVGGAISTLPDMHRYIVNQQHWLTDMQFNASVALAQAAPGPNILFVALMGWNIGLNCGGIGMGLLGVVISMVGIILPSATLTLSFANWSHKNRENLMVRAFKLGMAPIVIGLLTATGWIMASAHKNWQQDWALWLLAACSSLIVWRTRIHLLWLLGVGALFGWFGLI